MYKFKPLLKQTLWGGNRIVSFKHLNTDSLQQHTNIGESWEISAIPGSESIVDGGPDDGKSLSQLVAEQKGRLVGEDNYRLYGNEFPLLIKFIDAHNDLSIQVHPDDAIAKRHGHERGKTEMWYCLDPRDGASTPTEVGSRKPQLYCGLKRHITPEEYKNMVANDTITDALACYDVHDGDVFFIPAGRIHSIGAGCFVAEIQQTCDVTYRIYDFGRRDSNGNLRQLHTQQAAESINYNVEKNYRTHYTPVKDEPQQLVQCPFFTTAIYDLTEPMTLDYSDLDSFIIIICVDGQGTLSDGHSTLSMQAGETILLPATTGEISVKGKVKFLETYV